jgi:hypothetical protein
MSIGVVGKVTTFTVSGLELAGSNPFGTSMTIHFVFSVEQEASRFIVYLEGSTMKGYLFVKLLLHMVRVGEGETVVFGTEGTHAASNVSG